MQSAQTSNCFSGVPHPNDKGGGGACGRNGC